MTTWREQLQVVLERGVAPDVVSPPGEGKSKLRRWKRRRDDRIYAKAGGRCHYCGDRMTRASMTIDHVVPLSRGGANRQHNMVACCKRCNSAKGSRTADELGIGFWRQDR